MFTSNNFTPGEKISLSQEIALVGVQATPLTSLLMAKGNIEKALSTVYSWREKSLSHDEDISAVEGADTTVFYESARAELSNILEIFVKGVQVSSTAEAMNSTQFPSEVADRLLELKINIEKKLVNGLKNDASVAPFKRQMSGLIEFADSTNAVTGLVNEETIKLAMRTLWENDLSEGQIYALVNADIKEQVDNIYKGNYSYQHVTTSFGLTVDEIITNYGSVKFILSKHIPADKAIFFSDAYVDLVYLREPTFEPLSKNGDANRAHIVAEATLKVGSPKAVLVLTAEQPPAP